ncbi:uncharacterized protein DS421_16g544970 [Arachis hypogaea]|nr:uncharacterized protein DS421_16g544970 [Arachis hypogaea]
MSFRCIGFILMLRFTHSMMDIYIPHQHPDQPEAQVVPESEPMEKHVPKPIPEWDIPVEQISLSSSKPSSENLHTTSISGPTSMGQSTSTSARTLPKIIEISDDKDEDSEECSDMIEIFSDDDS